MILLVKVGIFILNIMYSFLKLFPVKNKIVYISRQSNLIPIDFIMIKTTMEEKLPGYKNIILARTIETGVCAKILYGCHMLRQIYHLATSKIVILDSYCIAVSVLKHRNSLLIIQIWHALGALKKFGYSILDKKEGTSSRIADLMKMHKNYSYVLASGEYCRVYFAEAFHQPIDKIKVFPLPRLDLLLDKLYQEQKKKEILLKYPFLYRDGKKIILYAPTFRKNHTIFKEGIDSLSSKLDYDRYNLIFKPHPLCRVGEINANVIYDCSFSTEDMIYVADYVITDYSAIIFEAGLLKKLVILYAFDYAIYTRERDFYLDYEKVFSKIIAWTIDDVLCFLQQDYVNEFDWGSFLNQVVDQPRITYTEDICNFLIKNMR